MFEYKVHFISKGRNFWIDPEGLVKELNELGKEGWEVVVIDPNNDNRILLKRSMSGGVETG